MTPQTVADILARIDRELWLITTAHAGTRAGLIATFVSTASIVPEMPRVLIGLAKQHHTWQVLEQRRAFLLHLLGEEHLDWVWRFGLASGHHGDKFAGLTVEDVAGLPLLPGGLAWLHCRVGAALDSGDRTLYLAEVIDGANAKTGPVLTTRRMVQLAPVDKLRALKEGLLRDAAVDAAAIRQWRLTSGSPAGST
jgi:flavin reductase (DIM6/NTAB) family NADH-FMN oxidoreductase RutF